VAKRNNLDTKSKEALSRPVIKVMLFLHCHFTHHIHGGYLVFLPGVSQRPGVAIERLGWPHYGFLFNAFITGGKVIPGFIGTGKGK